MEYIGRVFRPPSEARSVIVQATVGCSHNQCVFCDMYKEKRFGCRPVSDVVGDLQEMSLYWPGAKRLFLGDGDALAMPSGDLLKILRAANALFPGLERVSAYATPRSALLKSPGELRDLRENGLSMAYLGLESGDDETLRRMRKGASAGEITEAAKALREAGLTLSVTAISGLGGTERWREHATATAETLSAMNPEYIGLLTLRAEGQAPLVRQIKEGSFQMLSPKQILEETRLLIQNLDSPGSVFRSNHISNYLSLAGTLNGDKEALLARLDKALEGQAQLRSEEMRNWDLNHMG